MAGLSDQYDIPAYASDALPMDAGLSDMYGVPAVASGGTGLPAWYNDLQSRGRAAQSDSERSAIQQDTFRNIQNDTQGMTRDEFLSYTQGLPGYGISDGRSSTFDNMAAGDGPDLREFDQNRDPFVAHQGQFGVRPEFGSDGRLSNLQHQQTLRGTSDRNLLAFLATAGAGAAASGAAGGAGASASGGAASGAAGGTGGTAAQQAAMAYGGGAGTGTGSLAASGAGGAASGAGSGLTAGQISAGARGVTGLASFMVDSPSPSGSVGAAGTSSADIAARMANLAEEQWQAGQERAERFDPIYERLINGAADDADLNRQRSSQMWDRYTDTFQPVEDRMVSDAMNYDSPEALRRREGEVAGTVQRQMDAARGQQTRALASQGVTPSSGRNTMTTNANAMALGKAGAINSERKNTRLQGMSMRQNVANFGRGIPQTGMQASQLAGQSGNSAGNLIGSNTANYANSMVPSQNLFNSAIGGNNSAANIGLGNFNARNQQSASRASMIGGLAGLAGSYFASSSEKTKENRKPVEPGMSMDAIRGTDVDQWNYKPGEGDGGQHVGPMAENVQQTMGDEVAPGGQAIDLISTQGHSMNAIKDLDARLQKIEKTSKRKASAQDIDYKESSGMSMDNMKSITF